MQALKIFILFYFTLLYYILFYFTSLSFLFLSFTLLYFILFHFSLFLFYFILCYFIFYFISSKRIFNPQLKIRSLKLSAVLFPSPSLHYYCCFKSLAEGGSRESLSSKCPIVHLITRCSELSHSPEPRFTDTLVIRAYQCYGQLSWSRPAFLSLLLFPDLTRLVQKHRSYVHVDWLLVS